MLAAEKGNIQILNTLLQQKISKIDSKDKNGKTALFYAVDCSGENTDIILQLLNQRGCEINSECKNKETPLLRAVLKGFLNITKILLDHGSNISATLEDTGNITIKSLKHQGDNSLHISAK